MQSFMVTSRTYGFYVLVSTDGEGRVMVEEDMPLSQLEKLVNEHEWEAVAIVVGQDRGIQEELLDVVGRAADNHEDIVKAIREYCKRGL